MFKNYKAKLIEGEIVKSTKKSCGHDLFSTEDNVIFPGRGLIVGTGVKLEISEGYEGQVRGRSGLNFKHNVFCPTGTIDSDYKDEIKVKLYNFGTEPFFIAKGNRIAQIIISKVYDVEGSIIIEKERNGGFGSTGTFINF